MISSGDHAPLDEFALFSLRLAPTSAVAPPKCVVLNVNQDFFNAAPSGMLRLQILNAQTANGVVDPVIALSPADASHAGLLSPDGINFACNVLSSSPLDVSNMQPSQYMHDPRMQEQMMDRSAEALVPAPGDVAREWGQGFGPVTHRSRAGTAPSKVWLCVWVAARRR